MRREPSSDSRVHGATIACSWKPGRRSRPRELRQLCVEPIIEALLFLAVWAPGRYGTDPEKCDSTYLILSFKASESASAFVQLLSDPVHRTVLWEVSSLDYQPGLTDRLTPERQAALLARGFETGASPSNYRREVVIDGDASASEVAHEVLDILFEVLGYRGEEALSSTSRRTTRTACGSLRSKAGSANGTRSRSSRLRRWRKL